MCVGICFLCLVLFLPLFYCVCVWIFIVIQATSSSTVFITLKITPLRSWSNLLFACLPKKIKNDRFFVKQQIMSSKNDSNWCFPHFCTCGFVSISHKQRTFYYYLIYCFWAKKWVLYNKFNNEQLKIYIIWFFLVNLSF